MSRPFSNESAFRAVAHRVRRRALELLAKRQMRAGELHAAVGGSKPGASQHLQVLRNSGLVTCHRQGTSIVYALNRAKMRDVARWATMLSASR